MITYSRMHRTDKYSQHSSNIWLNGWVFLYELSGCGFNSCCSHLNFRFRACFEQGVPWHSGNYRVWIHSETHTWHDKNILLLPFHLFLLLLELFPFSFEYDQYSFLCAVDTGHQISPLQLFLLTQMQLSLHPHHLLGIVSCIFNRPKKHFNGSLYFHQPRASCMIFAAVLLMKFFPLVTGKWIGFTYVAKLSFDNIIKNTSSISWNQKRHTVHGIVSIALLPRPINAYSNIKHLANIRLTI